MLGDMSYRAHAKLPAAECAALKRYLDERGHAPACESIGIVKNTAYRAQAGASIARGTIALIRLALALAEKREQRR
jgi:hypothetical protein